MTGCGGSYTEAVPASPRHDPAHPTIVSLNPCTDAILAEVTEPGQLLAISDYSRNPSSTSMDLETAHRYRAVSGSAEEVAAIAPQVVVASSFLSPATANALREMGIRVETVPIAPDIKTAREQVGRLAGIAGRPELGQRLVQRIDEAVANAAPPSGASPVPAIVWQSGGLVAGDDTLIADMMKHSGFANVAGTRGLSQADFLPLEQVLANPPRTIFAVGNALAEEDRMLRHPALARLRDVTRVPLEGSMLWCGGPTIPHALGRLAAARRSFDKLRTSGRRAETNGAAIP